MGFSAAGIGSFLAANAGTVSAVAAGTSAAVGVASAAGAFGRPKVAPPSPVLSQASIDQGQQCAQENALRRQSIAGGLNSTVGTGGEAGQMLNPANLGSKSLLGQ